MNLETKLKFYRLNRDEFTRICELLGREPQGVEWALFSALWSEHCSYKSSKVHLRKFYSQSQRVVEGFGENAGVIDLGQGERVAFKMESHNHPSYIEPYQGAATGVGGILRDIFTMGARPIALANYLCFGRPTAARMPYLVDGVVRGIGGYGNCVGVPTVTGQTEFHSSYDGNILVNAMAVGLFRPGEKIFVSKAAGPGNCVVYVGAKTGKDGVHGASMASESFAEDSESKKPTVQIGDPFFEKLLIESCLEVMAKDLVVAIQDMGAAGLTSSSFEMASKGGVGLKLHLDKVPLRDATATPEEILLSESQERMLLICRPEKLDELQAVFKKWDLDAAVIGEVQKEQLMELYWHGEKICSVNPDLLVESAPVYERPYKKWKPQVRATQRTQLVPSVENLKTTLLELLSDISGTSRKWIYKQYDQRVGASTARGCEENFAVLRLPDSGRALGVALGCRPYVMRMDAALGGKDALFYPALEMAAKGFSTLAVTDCLNFGNPEKSEVMSEFVAAVEGLSHACHSLDAPVISGNVSFYNETHEKNVTSTPATGVVGLRDSLENIPYSQFKTSGQQIYLLRLNQFQHMGQVGEFLQQQTVSTGDLNETEMAEFTRFVCKLVNTQPVRASRVVGKFGLAYNLARMCTSQLGCVIHKGDFLIDESQQGSWLSETGYEVLLVVDKIDSDKFAKAWSQLRSPHSKDQLWRIGEVVRERFVIEGACDMSTDEVVRAYEAGWNQHFKSLA